MRLCAVTPVGTDPGKFLPDPYLVAAALRSDAILSHHSAFDLLGEAHSVFHRFPYVPPDARVPRCNGRCATRSCTGSERT